MPGARCTRGLVCKMHKERRTRAYRFSGGSPTFPAQWSLRLMPCSPRRRIRLVTVAAGLMADQSRLDRIRHRQLGTSNGCRDHTVLPYATSAVRPARRLNSLTRNARPAITLRADAAASTASHPAFVTIAIRPSCRGGTGQAGRTDLPDGESEIFLLIGLDRFLSRRLICPSGAAVGWAKALLRRAHHLAISIAEGWWARGACHRARIRATRWLCPPYAAASANSKTSELAGQVLSQRLICLVGSIFYLMPLRDLCR